MSNAIFPRFRGLTWPNKETIVTSTRVSKHVSGRVVTAQLYKFPLYEIELSFSGLSASQKESDWNFGAQSMQKLQAFYLARGGAFDPFLLKKSDYTGNVCDSRVEGGQIGVGDGAATNFTCLRFLDSTYSEPVGQVEPVLGMNVYVNGVQQAQTANFVTWATGSFPLPPNVVDIYNCTLTGGAPAAGSIITADYTFYSRVRFSEDTAEFDNIAHNLWKNDSLKFITTKFP